MSLPAAGPSKPPQPVDSDSEDDFMPALPPELLAVRKNGSTSAVEKPKGSIGPMLPPGFQRHHSKSPPRPRAHPFDEVDDCSDEEAGPMPLPAGLKEGDSCGGVEEEESEGVRLVREREAREEERARQEKESKAPKREAWMLLPPKETDLMASIDPTKLQKSRGFRQTSKPHAASTSDRSAGPSELWTETPDERAKRMEDEVLGKRRRTENSAADEEGERRREEEERKRRRRDEEMRKRVDEHNKSSRGSETLMDLHNQARTAVESDKSAAQREKEKKEAVIWDREAMMGLGGKLMGERERSKMVKDAHGLGGRFGGGSYL